MSDSHKPQIQVLNDRARYLLKTLIDCYVSDGHPVGSRTLAEAAKLEISTATIRNVMATLDHMGLVTSPHTSAGRIPTEKGLRLFVDSILEVQPLEKSLLNKMKQLLHPDQDKETLINTANSLISNMTHMAGIISIPKRGQLPLRHIEFLPLSDKRILAIMVVNEKEVQNRVIHVEREYTKDELVKIANYLNQNFTGRDIFSVRSELINELQNARSQVDDLMRATVEIADQVLRPSGEEQSDYRLQGKTNLIRFNELENTLKLQKIFNTFENKRDMLSLLDRCIQAEDIQVFIGREAGLEEFGDCSIITAPYSVDGSTIGVLGVIGPTRMQYSNIISVVDVTARLLGSALNPKI
ncbi:MAG: heat-inducible transcriptional repressor HrcA [Gammaproteobacteria bacterium]|nr:heat-inducible transcriptional repressor HrcA [Gammaproteobacteria bacterium]